MQVSNLLSPLFFMRYIFFLKYILQNYYCVFIERQPYWPPENDTERNW